MRLASSPFYLLHQSCGIGNVQSNLETNAIVLKLMAFAGIAKFVVVTESMCLS
jgi:hypothetical protein